MSNRVMLGKRCLKCMHGKKAKFDYARPDSTGHFHFRRKVVSGKRTGQWTGCPFGAAVDAGISPPPPLSLMKLYVRSHLVRRRPGTTTSRRLCQVWKQETQSCQAPESCCSNVASQKVKKAFSMKPLLFYTNCCFFFVIFPVFLSFILT